METVRSQGIRLRWKKLVSCDHHLECSFKGTLTFLLSYSRTLDGPIMELFLSEKERYGEEDYSNGKLCKRLEQVFRRMESGADPKKEGVSPLHRVSPTELDHKSWAEHTQQLCGNLDEGRVMGQLGKDSKAPGPPGQECAHQFPFLPQSLDRAGRQTRICAVHWMGTDPETPPSHIFIIIHEWPKTSMAPIRTITAKSCHSVRRREDSSVAVYVSHVHTRPWSLHAHRTEDKSRRRQARGFPYT